LILSIVAFAVLLLLLSHFKNENKINAPTVIKENNFVFEYFLLLAIVPNITVTDSEHFLFSIPLIAFIINFLFGKKIHLIYKITGIACLVMYGANMGDIVGGNISGFLTNNGILGLANFLIIIFCVTAYMKKTKNLLGLKFQQL
jgi:hypothetical protein